MHYSASGSSKVLGAKLLLAGEHHGCRHVVYCLPILDLADGAQLVPLVLLLANFFLSSEKTLMDIYSVESETWVIQTQAVSFDF
jgi:hypothetical protein